jgi:hypothetical protein
VGRKEIRDRHCRDAKYDMQQHTRAEKRYAFLKFEVMYPCCSQWLTQASTYRAQRNFWRSGFAPSSGGGEYLVLINSIRWELRELK